MKVKIGKIEEANVLLDEIDEMEFGTRRQKDKMIKTLCEERGVLYSELIIAQKFRDLKG